VIVERARAEVDRRAHRFRHDRRRLPLAGRTVVLVDDEIATGARARAACQVVRAQGAARVVLAGPVCSPNSAAEPAAAADADIASVVSRGGRPDLAGSRLSEVRAPTLLIVGGQDTKVLERNRRAEISMRCECRMVVVPGATHLFAEPGTSVPAYTALFQ
jgi:pimeloyl-ACP methyl ester carboxylesterase